MIGSSVLAGITLAIFKSIRKAVVLNNIDVISLAP